MNRLVVAALAAGFLSLCKPLPDPVSPQNDGSGGTGAGGERPVSDPTCESACANLGAVGCPEARVVKDCITACLRWQATPETEIDDQALRCLTDARNKPDARDCGAACQ